MTFIAKQTKVLFVAATLALGAGCVGEDGVDTGLGLDEVGSTEQAVEGYNLVYDHRWSGGPYYSGGCQIWKVTENVHSSGDNPTVTGTFWGTGNCASACRNWGGSYSANASYENGALKSYYNSFSYETGVDVDQVCEVSTSDRWGCDCPEAGYVLRKVKRTVCDETGCRKKTVGESYGKEFEVPYCSNWG